MKRSVYLPLMLISLAVLFLAGNHLSGALFGSVRVDLTEHGLYRLSPGTVAVIDQLNEPVEWRFYHSRAAAAQAPAVRAYATRVREYLETYVDRAGGRIRLIEIDPAPFSEDEDAAIAAGLIPIPAESGEQIWFGLVASNAVDDQAVIPLFRAEAEALLEYELTRLIADVERAQRPRLAVLTSLPLSPDSGAPNRFIEELNSAYELIWLPPDFDSLPDADAILLMHPGLLTQGQLYLIDQFALGQGRVVAFLDPMAHAALRPGPDGLPPLDARRESALGNLTARWGVSWDPQTVVMDRSLGLPVQIIAADGRPRNQAYPLWFSTGPAERSTLDLATSALDRNVNFGSPGSLQPVEGSTLSFEPLVTTSAFGAVLDADIAAGAPAPDELLRDYAAAPAPLILAARLSGQVETAFPDGPPAGDIIFAPADHRARSDQAVDIVLVADIDWLDDQFYLTRDPALGVNVIADNMALAMNLIDMAVGDPALVTLRSRATSDRLMTRVVALRAEARETYRETREARETEIAEARERLQALRGSGQSSALYSSEGAAARAEARQYERQIEAARRDLRDIEREFNRDINALDANLQLLTIGVPPFLVILAGLAGYFVRRRKEA